MDAAGFSGCDCLTRSADIPFIAPGERANSAAAYFTCNGLNGIKVTGRRGGKARLDDVYAKAFKRLGHSEFLARRHREARSLLSVAECGVKYFYVVGHLKSHFISDKEMRGAPLGPFRSFTSSHLFG